MKDLVVEGNGFGSLSYERAQNLRKEGSWRHLGDTTVAEALEAWIRALPRLTAKNYQSGIHRLIALRIINPFASLQAFALMNHDAALDRIKGLPGLSECSRQARAACYLSFTRFLSRRTQGLIPRATPSREGTSKTFFRVRDKVSTEAMTRPQWTGFLAELYKIGSRDCLIAKISLQGGKRIGEVLSLTTDQIDYSKGEISFTQSKTRGRLKQTVITYPAKVMAELKEYIKQRQGIVFVSKYGHPLHSNQLRTSFRKAGIRAGISFKITPHVLRASTVTYLKQQGFVDSDIMKVTGHASAEMIYAYDKSEMAENASKRVCLV